MDLEMVKFLMTFALLKIRNTHVSLDICHFYIIKSGNGTKEKINMGLSSAHKHLKSIFLQDFLL